MKKGYIVKHLFLSLKFKKKNNYIFEKGIGYKSGNNDDAGKEKSENEK